MSRAVLTFGRREGTLWVTVGTPGTAPYRGTVHRTPSGPMFHWIESDAPDVDHDTLSAAFLTWQADEGADSPEDPDEEMPQTRIVKEKKPRKVPADIAPDIRETPKQKKTKTPRKKSKHAPVEVTLC